uniref:Uncharacterized protein n=1 Tax=Solanum tuberosum TaxID=4113 RepID=M1DAY0_SOLTU
MTFKKINSKSAFASKSGFASVSASVSAFASASAKTDGSKFFIVEENILDITTGSMRHVSRNQAKLLRQQASRVPSKSAIVFGSSPKGVKVSCKSRKRRHRRNGREGSSPIEPIYIQKFVLFSRQ